MRTMNDFHGAHLLWEQRVVSSNLIAPTIEKKREQDDFASAKSLFVSLLRGANSASAAQSFAGIYGRTSSPRRSANTSLASRMRAIAPASSLPSAGPRPSFISLRAWGGVVRITHCNNCKAEEAAMAMHGGPSSGVSRSVDLHPYEWCGSLHSPLTRPEAGCPCRPRSDALRQQTGSPKMLGDD